MASAVGADERVEHAHAVVRGGAPTVPHGTVRSRQGPKRGGSTPRRGAGNSEATFVALIWAGGRP